MALGDEVVCRYNFRATRLFRKAVRYVAREQCVAEWQIVFYALASYKPVMEMMDSLKKGEKDVIG